jgi:solute carrier family 25 phosphate transporter 23/24/25/41
MPEPSSETPKRAVYDASISGTQDRPYIPHLRSDPPSYHSLPRTLAEFREQEGRAYRKARLRALWKQLLAALESDAEDANSDGATTWPVGGTTTLTPETARQMRKMYDRELMGRCKSAGHIEWKEFKKYAEDKEAGQSLSLSCHRTSKYINSLTNSWSNLLHDQRALEHFP